MSDFTKVSGNPSQSSESDSKDDQKVVVELTDAEELELVRKGGFPAGFTDNVTSVLETPQGMLKRVLQPNEAVIGEFECFFPQDMVPQWKIIFLLIITVGLYGLVLLYRSIERW
jgi:hypothetical protein